MTDIRIDSIPGVLTPQRLAAIMPHCDVDTWHGPLLEAMARWEIQTPRRTAAWLSQLAHESSECRHLEERLSYSVERLVEMSQPGMPWAGRFPSPEAAAPFARNPEGLANRVYGNRNGNRGEASGDGWLYRGRGLFQLTFRANYAACGAAIGLPLEEQPGLLLEPRPAALSAAWHFAARGCQEIADQLPLHGDLCREILERFRALTRLVNGGTAGLKERLAYWEQAREVLGEGVQDA